MFEPFEREFDDDVERSMDMFERARVGDVPAVSPRTPARLLLALDGTSQDATSRTIAAGLVRRFGCPVDAVDARQSDETNDLADEAATALGGRALPKTDGENYEQILAAIDASGSDLVIVPSPFQRELTKVGSDSTGTVIDVLLERSPVPLLVVRDECELEEDPFSRVVMVLVGENESAGWAAEWGAGMVAPRGRFELVLVLETETYENVRDLLHSLDPELDVSSDDLARAMQRARARLHRAIQKTAAAAGFQHRLLVEQKDDRQLNELIGGGPDPLIVLALERDDHLSEGHVHDRIRHSSYPLLVVPQTAAGARTA